ncbi:MAG TPA: hypothetical protein VIM11_23660, partial [Tepidisphaeraceae bacterium]
MQIIQCPSCGKRIDASGGGDGLMVCVACGAKVSMTWVTDLKGRAGYEGTVDRVFAPVEGSVAARCSQGHKRPDSKRWVAVVIASLVGAALVCGVLFAVHHGRATNVEQVGIVPEAANVSHAAANVPTQMVKAGEPPELQTQMTGAQSVDEQKARVVEPIVPAPVLPTTEPVPAPVPAPRDAKAPIVLHSDFPPEVFPATEPAPMRVEVPVSLAVQDAEVGKAIERAVTFILSQFRDGSLTAATELSDSQRQSLEVLCVYALAQAGQAIDDPRIGVRGKVLPAMLDHLRSYQLISDAEKTNRPITYGRSLRAAALATYDRPEDRKVLEADVAWLINAQIEGAYSYDDLYIDLMKKGMKPAGPRAEVPGERSGTSGNMLAGQLLGDDVNASMILAQDFGGGSPEPGLMGPYGPPPMGPISVAPPSSPQIPGGLWGPASPSPPGRSGGGLKLNAPTPPPAINLPGNYKGQYLITVPIPFSKVSPPGRNPVDGNSIGPKIPNHKGSPMPGGMADPNGHVGGDNTIPPIDWRFQFPWDNSNSQYGLLGVWAGAEVGVEVPENYWRAVEKHWLGCQLANGQWSYKRNDPLGSFAMTCGGVASLLVTHDYLDRPSLPGQVGRDVYSKGLNEGLAWLDRANNGVNIPNSGTHYLGYDLFGIERVGLASGDKYFGQHDWYRELSRGIVRSQFSNGAWGHEDHGIDTMVDTAYTLLFLSRGRHPILMTKLKFDRYW